MLLSLIVGFILGVLGCLAGIAVALWVGVTEERPDFQKRFQDDE